MKSAYFAVALALANPAAAAAIDEIMAANCGVFLALDRNPELMRDDVRETHAALLGVWILMTDAFEIDPPIDLVCEENPIFTVEEAMREAIKRVAK